MAVSYKKLWHILVDRNMKKKDLEEAAGITHYQMYKLANDKDITTDVIGAICAALDVEPNDYLYLIDLTKICSDNYEPEIINNPAQQITENSMWLIEPQSYHVQKIIF